MPLDEVSQVLGYVVFRILEGDCLHLSMGAMPAPCPSLPYAQVVGSYLQGDMPEHDIMVLVDVHRPLALGVYPGKVFCDGPTGQGLFLVGSGEYGDGVGGDVKAC